eukprot:TRINITY_DN49462_c0_g1_i1.p1 TRINITY_DN49462_c0_g1~~TRINITY_DN49462_c0_g1_i1.p1  ORF type:complete len:579 (-),score=81.26 TRINITY_DN49462_c0_g1_i1:67-1731(-)
MDDEFDRAARKHRLNQREAAIRVRQRQRQEADRQRTLASPLPPSDNAEPAGGAGSDPVVVASFESLHGPSTPASSSTAVATSAPKSAADDGPTICPGGPFTCFICTEGKNACDRFLPHKCAANPTNMCCKPCFVSWVESQIDGDSAMIKCCYCDLELQTCDLLHLLVSSYWDKYAQTALQRSLRRDTAFIWCSKCPSGGWVDPKQPTSQCGWSCPECSNTFVYCPHCRRDHGTLPCKKFQQLRREVFQGIKPHETQEKRSQGFVQRSSKMCPSCKMPIQKDGGCNFMDCPNCRRHFCWSCGQVLKRSHDRHKCDAGLEGSSVISKTPNGHPCVELTRLYTNVLDVDNLEILNSDPVDMEDLREMLVPGLSGEARSPLFIGPSECDGELMLRIPFNFQNQICWEITHLIVRASHPPAPGCRPPRSIGILVNRPSATFNDFDDSDAIKIDLRETGDGVFVAQLEQFRVRGTFRRTSNLALRFSACAVGTDNENEEEVFFNDFSIFGLPSDLGVAKIRDAMYDVRANLIVSPVLWGTKTEAAATDVDDGQQGDEEEE